jgi:hypothetical protein
VPYFLTIQFATEIARGSHVRDNSVILGDWMMSNPITQKGFVTSKIFTDNKSIYMLDSLHRC